MITQGLCHSFKREVLQGTHALETDTIKAALYTVDATLGPTTTAYSTTNEVAGTGYSAGGKTLTGVTVGLDEDLGVAYLDAADPAWTGATIAGIRAVLIYNASKANRAIAVLDLGTDVEVTAGTFTVRLPSGDANNAIVTVN